MEWCPPNAARLDARLVGFAPVSRLAPLPLGAGRSDTKLLLRAGFRSLAESGLAVNEGAATQEPTIAG